MKLVLLSALLVAALQPLSADASVEGVLPVGELRVTSPGIDKSGPVVVTARQSAKRFESFQVAAFGRAFELSRAELSQLQAGFVNGVQISYEQGYEQTGGRTVYVVISEGFTSGIERRQVVSINERGEIRVTNAK
jgi:hypothetical protein